MNNIYIIGYRGAGKSTVSGILSKKTGKKSVSMDEELEKKLGDIEAFVKKNTWDRFRDAESELLKEISRRDNIIVDCGGGIVEREENIAIIKSTGTAAFLDAPPETIAQRLAKDNRKRPSLTGRGTIEEIKDVLDSRIVSYKKTADIMIEAGKDSPEEIANEILWHTEALPGIAVCINEATAEAAIRKMEETENVSLLYELRMDYIKDIDEKKLEKIMKASKRKMIVTNRPKYEGGYFEGSENDRIMLLKKAAELGADYIDIEYISRKVNEFVGTKAKAKIICSYHNFTKIPDDLEELYEKMRKTKAHIIKMACTANEQRDNTRLINLEERARKDRISFIGIAMGSYGKISRVRNMLSGSEISGYVSAEEKKGTAPGQISLAEMKKIYMMVR